MDFSLFFFGSAPTTQTSAADYDWILKTASYADATGFTAVWTPERHFDSFGGLFPNPAVLGAAIAVVTNRIQIRSGSLVSPLHHSARIAEDWSVVDNLSKGRVAISFASGWQPNDFIFFPERYEDRHNCMLQQIAEVTDLWLGNSRVYKNGIGKETKIETFPKPIQRTLPVWVTVSGKTQTFVDAGRIGANVLTHLLWQNPGELVEKIKEYRNALLENGFDPATRKVAVMAHTFLHEDDLGAKQIVAEPLKKYIAGSVHLIEKMISDSPESARASVGRYGNVTEQIPPSLLNELTDIAFERFYKQSGLLGSPEKCRSLVEELAGYGVDEIACLVDFGVSHEQVSQSLSLLASFKDQCQHISAPKAQSPGRTGNTEKNIEEEKSPFVQNLKEEINEEF